MATTPTVGFIASTIPAQTVRVSGTTLFQVAQKYLGDPLQWVAIAELNNLTDPWITAEQEILIPPVIPSGPQTGILGL
jgi:nucleoid-associated protein YgaU